MPALAELMALGVPWGVAQLLTEGNLPNPITDFGAKGDGVTDDTAALQEWASWCSQHQQASTLPPGATFAYSGQLVIDGFSIVGPGFSSVTFQPKAGSLGAGIAAIRIQNTIGADASQIYSGFSVNGPGVRTLGVKTANADGVEFYGNNVQSRVSGLRIQNFDSGAKLNCTAGNLVFADNHFTNNYYNLYQIQSGNNITFTGRNGLEGATYASIATQYNQSLYEWVLGGAVFLGFAPFGLYQEGTGVVQQTITSGAYNNGTGVVTLTMSAPVPGTITVGATVGISALAGTGAFAQLQGSGYQVLSVSGTTLTYQGPSGVGASTITGGKLDLAGTQGFIVQSWLGPGVIFEAIGNAAILSDLTGNGGPNDGGFAYNQFLNCGFSWNNSYKIPSRDQNYAAVIPFWRGPNTFSDYVSPFAKGALGTFNIKNGYTGTLGSLATLIGPRNTSAPWQDDGTLFNNNVFYRLRQTWDDPYFLWNSGDQGLNVGNPFAGDRIQILGGHAGSNQVVITPDPTSADASVNLSLKALNGNVFLSNTTGNSSLQCQLGTGSIQLSINGSDNNSAFIVQPKGGSSFQVNEQTQNKPWFAAAGDASSANYVRTLAAHTGSAPQIQALGSDTNVDLLLTPQGTGNVSFGTYTGGAPTATGYITIKDAGGTARKILVG